MHVSTGGGSNAQLMQLAQNLTQGQNGHSNFQAQLNQQSTQGGNLAPQQANASENGQGASNNLNQGTTQGTSTAQGTMQSMFNTMGNLSSSTNLKDFSLLTAQQAMLQQVNLLNNSIHQSQLAALQPATFAQISLVIKMFDQALQKYRHTQRLQHAFGATSPEALHAQEESKMLLIGFLERCNKIFEQPKNLALSRFFKKGPLGEHMHEEDTDDEYGTVYNDVDAETDYIKRPRRFKQDMLFHYSLLT